MPLPDYLSTFIVRLSKRHVNISLIFHEDKLSMRY